MTRWPAASRRCRRRRATRRTTTRPRRRGEKGSRGTTTQSRGQLPLQGWVDLACYEARAARRLCRVCVSFEGAGGRCRRGGRRRGAVEAGRDRLGGARRRGRAGRHETALPLALLDVGALLGLRERAQVGRVEGERRLEAGGERGRRAGEGRREGGVGREVGEAGELGVGLVEAGAQLGRLALLKVELGAEVVVVVLEVGDAALVVVRQDAERALRPRRCALGVLLLPCSCRRRRRRARGGRGDDRGRCSERVRDDDAVEAEEVLELVAAPLEEGRVLLLAVARGLGGVCEGRRCNRGQGRRYARGGEREGNEGERRTHCGCGSCARPCAAPSRRARGPCATGWEHSTTVRQRGRGRSRLQVRH